MTVAGPRGPIPKRSDQRRRRNKPDQPTQVVTISAPKVPTDGGEPEPDWHPLVQDLYRSLTRSGTVHFYEPSDWAFARITCEILSRSLSAEKMPAMLLASTMADLARLGVTEADRRRMRMELEREEQATPASVSIMEKYRKDLSG